MVVVMVGHPSFCTAGSCGSEQGGGHLKAIDRICMSIPARGPEVVELSCGVISESAHLIVVVEDTGGVSAVTQQDGGAGDVGEMEDGEQQKEKGDEARHVSGASGGREAGERSGWAVPVDSGVWLSWRWWMRAEDRAVEVVGAEFKRRRRKIRWWGRLEQEQERGGSKGAMNMAVTIALGNGRERAARTR